MRSETQVLAANTAFYDAFAARDIDAMDTLWARCAPVACIHPGWQPLRGRDAVIASWKAILGGSGSPPITAHGAVVHVLGEAAFVVCVERLPGAHLLATNVFVLEDGAWRLVHHHVSAGGVPSAAEEDDEPSGLLH